MVGLLGAVHPYAHSGLARFGVGLGTPSMIPTQASTFFGAQLPNSGGG
jgi:hypothetical protein